MRQIKSTTSLRLLGCTTLLLVSTLCYCQDDVADISNECNRNCTGIDVNPLCGSNGITYNNTCEMRRASCIEGITIEQQDEGPCVTPTTPEFYMKGETCEQHRERIYDLKSGNGAESDVEAWRRECNKTLIRDKITAGNLTIRDMISCYRPECTNLGTYAQEQCYSLDIRSDPWCWCSGPTGLSIDDTLSLHMEANYCSFRSSCQHQELERADGEVFQPDHQCGICECLDGEVTCFEDFVPDVNGRLNTSQLSQLSGLLKQLFYFENNRKDSILYDIRKIHKMISQIPEDVQTPILIEWFNHYDSNGNGHIQFNHAEETAFHSHLSQFTSCKHFLDHVSEEIDMNNSGAVTREEWLDFFSRYTSGTTEEVPVIGKRSASEEVSAPRRQLRRTLENRKKFYYIMY